MNKCLNDSTGTGPQGETDVRGSWNSDGFEYEESPAFASKARKASVRQQQRR